MKPIKIVLLAIYNEDPFYYQMKKINENYFDFLNKNSEIMKTVSVFYVTYKKLNGLEYSLEDNILYIDGEENYIPGILDKTIGAFDIITNKLGLEYDFLLRTNASTFINFHELHNYIETFINRLKLNTDYYMIGPYNKLAWIDPNNGIVDMQFWGIEYCGGAFILMNKLLINNILKNKKKLINTLIDDVSIGHYVNSIENINYLWVDEHVLLDMKEFSDKPYFAYVNNRNKQDRIIDVLNMKYQVDKVINEYQKKYSIVLPIHPNNDLNQIIMNINLMNKYIHLPNLYKMYIITSTQLAEKIKHYTHYCEIYYKIMFIDEEELQPKYEGKNWYYQQILKLKIANFIKTKYYLILDIDMYLIKPLCFDDMFYENKIIYTHEKFPHNNPPGYTNTSWWENSAKLLNYNVEKLFDRNDLMGVTPQLLLTCVVKDILLLMESKYGVNWEITLIDKSFTEFTLYWIFLIQNNMEQYYTTNGFPLLDVDEEHTVLHPNSNETIIRVTNQALSSRKYHFFLVQNWLKIDLSVYWHLLPLDSF